MKKAAILILLILVGISYSCTDNRSPDFENEWDEDVYYFGKNLKEKHKNLFFNLSESEFENDINALRQNTSNLTEAEILIELTKIISKIGDSHTQVQFGNRLTLIPILVEWLADGIFLTTVNSESKALLGKRIIEINDTPIDEVIDKFRSVIAYENESNFKNHAVIFLLFAEFYPALGISESIADIRIKFANESVYIPDFTATDIAFSEVTPVPLFLKNTSLFYWFEQLQEEGIIYIQYNACRERNDLSFEAFTSQIAALINSNQDLKKVVIDLRHNGGGNSAIMKPLIDLLEGYVEDQRFPKEKVYLIIGRKTFSSAVLNTIELKKKIELTLLGEPSGGKPNHYGEVKSFQLPNSDLKVFYSTKYFDLSSNDDDSVYPDEIIDYTSEHFFNGIDPVLEKIKED